jgi:hypothetical protein
LDEVADQLARLRDARGVLAGNECGVNELLQSERGGSKEGDASDSCGYQMCVEVCAPCFIGRFRSSHVCFEQVSPSTFTNTFAFEVLSF